MKLPRVSLSISLSLVVPAFLLGGTRTRAASLAATAPSQISRALPLNHFFAPEESMRPGKWVDMRTAIGDDYFNGASSLGRVKRHFEVAHRAGVKYLRCAFSWDAIEPRPGIYDWHFWDALVQTAGQNGIQLLPYVAYTPKWAANSSAEYWKQPPRDPRLYAGFMYKIARRYRGPIRSWEIWNEPDNKDYWTGSPDAFATMAIAAAKRIREADPHAVLILGGMAYGPGLFFRRLIAHDHIDRYVDVIAMHGYPETWDNERAETVFQQWIPAMSEMIASDRTGDSLWVNEMGYADYRFAPSKASMYGVSVYYNYEHTREYQATMLFKFETMARASGKVSLVGWYRIDDFLDSDKRSGPDLVNNHLGLVDAKGKPKPDLLALAFFNRLFAGPARVIHPKLDAPPDSQSVVEVFHKPLSRDAATQENHGSEVIVVGWLRSSRASEVSRRTGTLHDARAETISIALPCSEPSHLSTFNVEGAPAPSFARISGTSLTDVPLSGGRVFIATVACRP